MLARCGLEIMLHEFPDQLIVTQHHIDDEYSSPWTDARGNWYGITGVPHVFFDGKYDEIGGSGCELAANDFRQVINLRLAETAGMAPIAIEGTYDIRGSTVSVSATFTLEDPVVLSNPRAYLIVQEDGIIHADKVYNHMTRAVYEEDVTLLDPGDDVVLSTAFAIDPAWDPDQLRCIAFIQRMDGDKEVYQAAPLPRVADFEFAYQRDLVSIPTGNGWPLFEGTLINTSDQADLLTVSLDDSFGWSTMFRIAGETDFHTDPVIVPLDVQGEIQVYLRVVTDQEVRIGEGGLIIESQISGRSQIYPARIFNGSPSIMLVDDDGIRPDEILFQDALDERGYLYDHWDVFNDHWHLAPVFETVKYHDL